MVDGQQCAENAVKHDDLPELEIAGLSKKAKRSRLRHQADLGCDDELAPGETVNQHPTQKRDRDDGQQRQEAHHTQPKR